MLEILKIEGGDQLISSVLRERAYKCRGGWAHFYLVKEDDVECGLLCYDDLSSYGSGQIQEIFVLEQFRRRGIGNMLLQYAEKVAVGLKCRRIQLKPYALELSGSTQMLTDWYATKGYSTVITEPDHMEKFLVPRQMDVRARFSDEP